MLSVSLGVREAATMATMLLVLSCVVLELRVWSYVSNFMLCDLMLFFLEKQSVSLFDDTESKSQNSFTVVFFCCMD